MAKPTKRLKARPAKDKAKPAGAKDKAKPARSKPAARRPAKPAAKKPAATKKPAVAKKRAAKRPAATKKPAAMKKPAARPTRTPAAPPRDPPRGTGPLRAIGTIPPDPVIHHEAPAPLAAAPLAVAPPPTRSGIVRVVAILEDDQPITALRRYLDTIPGDVSVQEGQVALGAAQLLLLPIAREHRGGDAVKELLDLVLERWSSFPDRTGFHANEFLRNAFAAVGGDRARITRLLELVPAEPSPELRFSIACAYAVVGDRHAMLDAVREALAAGATPAQFRRDNDFAAHASDPELQELLGVTGMPAIPVDVAPHVGAVHAALDDLVATLARFGEVAQLRPPSTLEAVLAAERAAGIQLPNDYRALLTLTDGFLLLGAAFLGTEDYRTATLHADAAREYLERSSRNGATGIEACVPLANWGQPNDWLLYDPHGDLRGDAPGYVLVLGADESPLDGLVEALADLADTATEVLGTN